MKGIIVATLLGLAAPAMAADQFDLHCVGKNLGKAISKDYRVDLSAQKWCQGECSALDPIAEIRPEKIVFRYKAKSFATDSLIIEEVDRTTGAWKDRTGVWWDSEGSCEPRPFSGFPTITTKF